MAKEIIDFFQIIHIQENQTSGMLLHQLGNHHFSLTAHRQTSQIVIILAVSLTSHGSHDIRKEFSGFPFQICNTISIFCFQTFFFYFHFSFFQQTQKQICDLWIKLCSSVFAKFLLDHFCRQSTSINSSGIHCIITVCHSHNPCINRDLISHQSIRISLAIISLMMISGHICHMLNHRNILQNICPDHRMRFDQSIFIIRQSGWLIQNSIWNTDFSHIMKISCIFQIQNLLLTPAKLSGYQSRILSHTVRMAIGILILGFQRG